jgi:hypothetical protein
MGFIARKEKNDDSRHSSLRYVGPESEKLIRDVCVCVCMYYVHPGVGVGIGGLPFSFGKGSGAALGGAGRQHYISGSAGARQLQ